MENIYKYFMICMSVYVMDALQMEQWSSCYKSREHKLREKAQSFFYSKFVEQEWIVWNVWHIS